MEAAPRWTRIELSVGIAAEALRIPEIAVDWASFAPLSDVLGSGARARRGLAKLHRRAWPAKRAGEHNPRAPWGDLGAQHAPLRDEDATGDGKPEAEPLPPPLPRLRRGHQIFLDKGLEQPAERVVIDRAALVGDTDHR